MIIEKIYGIIPSATKSSNMTKQFRNLKAVVLAYQMPESTLYQQRDVYEEIVSEWNIFIKFLVITETNRYLKETGGIIKLEVRKQLR